MATKLINNGAPRYVVRETAGRDPMYNQILIVKLGPYAMEIRQKKRRHGFTVTYADIFRLGFMAAVKAAKADKRRKRSAAP